MVTDFRHCKGLVIIVISFVSGRSCKYLYRLEGTPCKMSRCCPYPPPGYEKKAQVGLGLTHKKKHKHKDKKRKRKRENETSGGNSHDKDKNSKNSQQFILSSELPSGKNVSGAEVKDFCPAPLANPITKTELAYSSASRSKQFVDDGCHGTGSSNGTAIANAGDVIGCETDLLKQREHTLAPHIFMEAWSVIDDLEWLFLTNNKSHSMSREERRSYKTVEDSLVWDETKLLASADIYALPYVVPY